MKEGLEEFLKRIEAKPTNETLIDRFVTLVLEEEVLERVLYLKKLVGLLLTPNPYAALKAAALELQEARKERLTKEYEIGALKDVESCFLKLDKMDNAHLVREEINKLQGEMSREQTSSRSRTAPPPNLPQIEQVRDQDEDEDSMSDPPARQARVHFRLPKSEDDEEPEYEERTKRNVPSDYEPIHPPAAVKSGQRSAPESLSPKIPVQESSFNPDALSYLPKKRASNPEAPASFASQKEFYDKNLEEPAVDRDEVRRSSLSRVSGLKVGPNLLEEPDEREQAPRPRNIASVFETTDVFGHRKSSGQGQSDKLGSQDRNQREEPDFSAKGGKSDFQKAKNKSRTPFESSDYTSENESSNSMFQESQHVHFPENTSNRSMTKQELRAVAAHEKTARHSASPPLENTEILPDSRRLLEVDDYDDEATRQLEPEELIRASMPVEPAFPAREFEAPAFELAPKKSEPVSIPKSAPSTKEAPKKNRDPFDTLRDTERDFFNAVKGPQPSSQDPFAVVRQSPVPARDLVNPKEVDDPFAGVREPSPLEVRTPARDAFAPARETVPENLDPFASPGPIGLPKESHAAPKEVPLYRPPSATQQVSSREAPAGRPVPPIEPKWNLLRDRLRLLSGVQISRSHANDFVLRLLGENATREQQQQVLSILMRVLDSQKQALAEQRFLAFLFEELHPKALHQLLGALKIGDQTVVFFVDYLQSLVKDRQLRRTLNVIHAVIVPGLDVNWYQEAYRFLMLVWPELGLKGWHWLEEEGPMAFCDRLSEREDLFPATLLA